MRARERMSFLDGGRPPATDCDAATLVDQRGFALLGADAKLGLPSLSAADPDREWSVSWRAWRWKETLPAAGRCAYLKWFRNQGTFISWRVFPDFYAIWGPRHDDPVRDSWRAGVLGRDELDVLDIIHTDGPVSSREIWRKLRFQYGGKRSRLLNALARLQKGLYVMVSSGDLDGWSMHNWDLVTRQVPEDTLSRLPAPAAAQRNLVLCAFRNLACSTPREVAGLFGWAPADAGTVAEALTREGALVRGVTVRGRPGAWYCTKEFAADARDVSAP